MLRTTNISPGSVSKIVAGSARLSAQAMIIDARALALGQARDQRSRSRSRAVLAEAAISVDQLAKPCMASPCG